MREGLRNISFQEENVAGLYLEVLGEGAALNHAQLERVKLPFFSGKIEDWPDFKATFKQLIAAEGYEPIIEVTQLKSRLPAKVADLLQGLREPATVWARLEEKYGNINQTIIASINKLHGLQLPKNNQAGQVEALASAISKTKAILASVGAERDLFVDLATLGILIMKLPQGVQDRWLLQRQDLEEYLDRQTEGEEFMKWLERERKAAVASQLLAMRTEGRKLGSIPAGGNGHQDSKDTTDAHANLAAGSTVPVLDSSTGPVLHANLTRGTGTRNGPTSEAEVKEWKVKASAAAGKCPKCSQEHNYQRKFPGTNLQQCEWPSSRLSSCPSFKGAIASERTRMVEAHGGCAVCTSWLHKADKCRLRDKESSKCRVKTGDVTCGGEHHEDLHGSNNAYCHTNSMASDSVAMMSRDGPGLFEVYRAEVGSDVTGSGFEVATLFVDPGSDTNFISDRLVGKLKLEGTPVTYYLRVVDTGYREHKTTRHELLIKEKDGEQHKISALAIPSITTFPPARHLYSGPPAKKLSTRDSKGGCW